MTSSIRRLLLATAAGLLAWPFAAQAQAGTELLATVSRRLDNPPVLRGTFEQTKTLQGFKRPLLSQGSFVMARERGVQWATTHPFASTVVITRDRLLTISENGQRQQLDARQQPGLRAVNDMLMALLAGDIQALGQQFSVEGNLSGAQGWRLVLTPRDAALAGFVKRIELEGERHVNQVVLLEASSDTSRIRFSKHTTAALTAEETVRFGP